MRFLKIIFLYKPNPHSIIIVIALQWQNIWLDRGWNCEPSVSVDKCFCLFLSDPIDMRLWAQIFALHVSTICILKLPQRKRELQIPEWSGEKTNYFCDRYLIFCLQNFAFLTLAPSCMWLRGLEIRQLGLPKIQGAVWVSLFPACAVFQVLIPLLFVVPSHCLQGTSFPYPCSHGNKSLCSSSSGSVSSSPLSAALFCNLEVAWFSVTTFFPLLSNCVCLFQNLYCEYTDSVCDTTLTKVNPDLFSFFSQLTLNDSLQCLAVWKRKELLIIILNLVLPLIHARSITNWIETASILKLD